MDYQTSDALNRMEFRVQTRLQTIERGLHDRIRAVESRLTELETTVIEFEKLVHDLEQLIGPPNGGNGDPR